MSLTPERRSENMRLREAATPNLVAASRVCDWIQGGIGDFQHYVAKMASEDDDKAVFIREQRLKTRDYIVAACNDLPLYEAALAEREREIERLLSLIHQIDKTLMIPAAEYVPAIGDVFKLIDDAKCGAFKS